MSGNPIFNIVDASHSTAINTAKYKDFRVAGRVTDGNELIQKQGDEPGSQDEGGGVFVLLSHAGDACRKSLWWEYGRVE